MSGARAAPVQTYARAAGLLALLSLVAGGFGEFYVPTRLMVPGDAAATANNILASWRLFRLGVAGYLVEALCDVGLTVLLYLLLRPVRRDLALLAASLRVVSTAVFAVAELFFFAPSLILGGGDALKGFSPDQLQALAFLSLRMYGSGAIIPMVLYGAAWIILGYLIVQSGYLPKFLGALLALGGAACVLRYFALVVVPAYAPAGLLLPMMIGGLLLTVWLLVKGVDMQAWQASAAAGR